MKRVLLAARRSASWRDGEVGHDASRIADAVIAHLSGLVSARVTVTLEVQAEIPSGASDHVVHTVIENSRMLTFISQGYETEVCDGFV